MIYALIGFLVAISVLIIIGITQPRGTSIVVWCYFYLIIAVIFDGLAVFSLIYQIKALVEALLGVSVGSATGLAIHVSHHIIEEKHKKTN